MLSRLAPRSKAPLPCLSFAVRQIGSLMPKAAERDEINFPRRTVPNLPDKVRLGFIPDDWFKFFYPKTGVTGPYVFGGALSTYLLSKEILVVDHEFLTGVVLFGLIYFMHYKYGKQVADYLDKQVDEEIKEMDQFQVDTMEGIKSQIQECHTNVDVAKANSLLFEAKKENIGLQLEAAYRERLSHVYKNVKDRLDYQIEIEGIKSRVEQKHMVNWIVDSVKKSITPTQEVATMKQCLVDLKALATRV